MITVVQKAFQGELGMVESGTVLDSTAFRLETKLISQRYLRAASHEEAEEFLTRPTVTEKRGPGRHKQTPVMA